MVDLNALLQRVRALLLAPVAEWPVIAAEPATPAGLYREYILFLAAIPAICGFVKVSLIGYAWHGFRIYRLGIGAGVSAALVFYAMTLIAVYVIAVIVDALAPNFGGEQSRVQALKLVAYSYTASWIAGFGRLLPWLSALVALAGAAYSVYLLYLGLPTVMRVPAERSAGYTAAIVIIAIVVGYLVEVITGGIAGAVPGLD